MSFSVDCDVAEADVVLAVVVELLVDKVVFEVLVTDVVFFVLVAAVVFLVFVVFVVFTKIYIRYKKYEYYWCDYCAFFIKSHFTFPLSSCY